MAALSTVSLPNMSNVHFEFKSDPHKFLSLVHKYIKVETSFNTAHIGYVYTVDPVTGSYVLLRPSADDKEIKKIEVVLGHTVTKLAILDEQFSKTVSELLTSKMDGLCNKHGDKNFGPEEIARKRGNIIAWLRKNFIPIKQDANDPTVLTLMNAVQIIPPYNADNCYSDNEMILGKMQGLLSAMPDVPDDDDL